MHDLALGDPGGHTGPHRPLEDVPEPLGAPTLPNARQRGMIRQPIVQPFGRLTRPHRGHGPASPGEPADREIDLCLAHEPPVMHDTEKETGQHQAHGCFRRDTGSADADRIEIGPLRAKPPQIKHSVDADKDVIVWDKVT